MPKKLVYPAPSIDKVPNAVTRQRVTQSKHVARPRYAAMEVKLVVVRSHAGYETGIGLRGAPVAELVTTLANAQKLLTKIANRWGSLKTRKIPNVGLDILIKDELVDNHDYNAANRSQARYEFTGNQAVIEDVIKNEDLAPERPLFGKNEM